MPAPAEPLSCKNSSTSAATDAFALKLSCTGLPSVMFVVSGVNVNVGFAPSPEAPLIVMTALEIFATL